MENARPWGEGTVGGGGGGEGEGGGGGGRMRGLPCYHEFYMSMSGGPTGNQNAVHANSMDQTQCQKTHSLRSLGSNLDSTYCVIIVHHGTRNQGVSK